MKTESDCHLLTFDDALASQSNESSAQVTTAFVATMSPSLVKVESSDYETQNNSKYSDLNTTALAKSSDRDARNRAEKMRRNKLNAYIGELSLLLPAVVQSPRKIDKTGILRLAANDLRKDHVFGNSISSCHMDLKPMSALSLLDDLGGFLITITCKGVITILSPNVQNYLGHCQVDLLGQNFYALVHPEDRSILESHIYPPELQNGPIPPEVFKRKSDFTIRLLRASPRSEPIRYEVCRIDGTLRRADRAVSTRVQDDQVIRRTRVRRDRTTSSSGNDVVFVGMVKVLPKVRAETPLLVSYHQEYWTRHLTDGRIVQCDQRISLVAGYLTEEITGVSGFTFMHRDDVRWVVIALRQMYDQNKEFGESCYRLLSRTGDFVYLKTRGFLEVDSSTKTVKSFVCVNSLVSPEEGRYCNEEMKRKYSALVNLDDDCIKSESDGQRIEDPCQLEDVIKHLVTNIRDERGGEHNKSLVVVTPEPISIRSAIEKSVSVIRNCNLSGGLKSSGTKRPSCESQSGSDSSKKRPFSDED